MEGSSFMYLWGDNQQSDALVYWNLGQSNGKFELRTIIHIYKYYFFDEYIVYYEHVSKVLNAIKKLQFSCHYLDSIVIKRTFLFRHQHWTMFNTRFSTRVLTDKSVKQMLLMPILDMYWIMLGFFISPKNASN